MHADFRQDYARALEAYKSGNYAEAQNLFAQAVADHPEPAARLKLYGMRFEPYVPQHYLGLIAAQSGDCGRARAQWNAAGNAQVVAEIGVAANEKCVGSVAQNRPASPPPTTMPAASVSPPVTTSPPVASTPQRPPVTQAQVEPTKPVAAPPVVAKAPPPPPSRPAESPPDRSGPPEQLLNAFQSYLSGRLTEVSRINPDAFADARARFQAYLVRGGARFTLAKLSGSDVELESARADVRAARQLNAGATPDATLFSPRFREFYAETR